MRADISAVEVVRVARALGDAPDAAYTTPIVYPWATQNFVARPQAPRPQPPAEPLRLYVHVPFCRYHCTFCFYAVRTGAKRQEMERYVAALERELRSFGPGPSLSRLTVGGGTPTALPPDLLEHALAAIAEHVPAAAKHESTLEASPDSLAAAHIRVLRRYGIGRVSIGIESTNETILGAVHRRHDRAQALAACRMVADSGLSLNIDLIYGLPGQTEDDVRRDLETVAEAQPHSLCLYALRLNEKTPVAARLDAGEHLDLARLMRWRAFVRRTAEESGFTRVRPYAYRRRDDATSWYDRGTTPRGDGLRYEIGLGMSARSQLGPVVYRNHERADVYMWRVEAGLSPVESIFELDTEDLKTQFVAGSLGNGRPLDRARYRQTFGVSIDDDFGKRLERLRGAALLEDDRERIVLTETGMLVYDRVLLCFYPERAKGWLRSRIASPRRAGPG